MCGKTEIVCQTLFIHDVSLTQAITNRPEVLFSNTQPVVLSLQVFADATIIFPLLVAETFAVHAEKKTTGKKKE